jgi:hypothetical protein
MVAVSPMTSWVTCSDRRLGSARKGAMAEWAMAAGITGLTQDDSKGGTQESGAEPAAALAAHAWQRVTPRKVQIRQRKVPHP